LWFIVVLVGLAALITLFLCIPVELIFHANSEGRPKFSLKLVWFFGLFKSDLGQFGKKSPKKSAEKLEKPARNWLQDTRVSWEIFQTKGLFRQLRRFVMRTIRSVRVKEFAANLKVDLENPADTGLLFAFIAPLNLAVNRFLPYPINIEPSFTGESFLAGHANAIIRLIPIQLAASLGGLAFSLPALRAIKKLVLYKWKRKR
jgi:hypothetical protein